MPKKTETKKEKVHEAVSEAPKEEQKRRKTQNPRLKDDEERKRDKSLQPRLSDDAKAHAPRKEAASKNNNHETKAVQLKEGKARDIGVPVANPPKLACSDPNCPYHGHLSIRGRIFEGSVISDKMDKGVVVEWDYLLPLPKYKRFMRKKSRVPAHNPQCINARTGNVVRIAECRPLSKTKSFVVIETLK